MPLCISEMDQTLNTVMKPTNDKNAHENEKNITGPHACVFRKWAERQKQLKSTELDKDNNRKYVWKENEGCCYTPTNVIGKL